MGLFEWFKKRKGEGQPLFEDKELIEVEVCPNCWGRQEWDHQFLDAIEDRQVDVNNKYENTRKAFIQKFVEEHVDGIRLKKDGDQLKCPACQTGYKTVYRNV